MRKNIAILGSTGSIGVQALEVIEQNSELFNIVALAAGSNIELLEKQIRLFKPGLVSVANKQLAESLSARLDGAVNISYGMTGLNEVASYDAADYVLNSLVGSIGLQPTLTAIESKKTVGLANKETLVAGGHIVMELAQKNKVSIIPIDSEHSAIFQALNGENINHVEKLIITASGGSFRDLARSELEHVTVGEALKHPNWEMGAKITIDSATMVNKGLEVIEAHWLFSMPYKKIEVLIHPESIIHSMVQYIDKSVIAQLGNPDMRVPIQYALSYPERINLDVKELSFLETPQLNFKEPDFKRFPALKLAFDSGLAGGTAPAVFNAANEVAVAAFLSERVPFLAIEEIIERVLTKHTIVSQPDIEEILAADSWARLEAGSLIV